MHGEKLKSCSAPSMTPCSRYKSTAAVVITAAFIAVMQAAAYADSNFVTFATYLIQGLRGVYKVVLLVSGAIVAFDIGYSGFVLLAGAQKTPDAIRKVLLYSALGLFVIWAAPLMVQMAREPLTSYVSNPGVPVQSENYTPFAEVAGLAGQIQEIWNFAESIVLGLAILGVVTGALMFFGINVMGYKNADKTIDAGKLMIKYTLVALICFYMLPIVLKSGYAMFSAHGWNPPSAYGQNG